MKDIKDVVVMVQARMGSQRTPKKMLKPVHGTNLFEICLKKLKHLKSVDQSQVYVSVYEQELKDVANKVGINVFDRSEASANSEGTPMTEMYEWWDKLPFKYCILVNGCAPFLEIETIDNFVEAYCKTGSDGMFGVIEKKNYFWNDQHEFLTPLTEAVMNTKLAKPVYEAAHCLYAGRLDKIGKSIWMGDFNKPGDIELFPMPENECFDIDYPWQFELFTKIYEK
jgi:CMP-N-acetylneuraminic acid synthetase